MIVIVDLIGLSFASAGLIQFEMTLLVGFGWRGWASFKKPSKTTFGRSLRFVYNFPLLTLIPPTALFKMNTFVNKLNCFFSQFIWKFQIKMVVIQNAVNIQL